MHGAIKNEREKQSVTGGILRISSFLKILQYLGMKSLSSPPLHGGSTQFSEPGLWRLPGMLHMLLLGTLWSVYAFLVFSQPILGLATFVQSVFSFQAPNCKIFCSV